MQQGSNDKKTIGRVEIVGFPTIDAGSVHARIDTGAHTSAIWVSKVIQEEGRIGVVFFDKQSRHYTGDVHYFDTYERAVVASSNGEKEERFKIRLPIRIAGRKIRARFTLADRSTQVYPVLIGRNVLRGKFLVDVQQGEVLRSEEQRRSNELQSAIKKHSRRGKP